MVAARGSDGAGAAVRKKAPAANAPAVVAEEDAAAAEAEAAFGLWDEPGVFNAKEVEPDAAADEADTAALVDAPAEEAAVPVEAKPAAPAAKKVKLKKSIMERVKSINAEANLSAPLKVAKVAEPLSSLPEAQALEVLDSMLEELQEDEDPTKWLCRAVKERKAWLEWEVEEFGRWEAKQEAGAQERFGTLEPEVVEAVRKLNRSGRLVEPLSMKLITGPLSLLKPVVALDVLRGLEMKAENMNRPSGYIKAMAMRRTSEVMAFVDQLNAGGAGRMDLITPLDPSKVREPLAAVPDTTAMSILKELEGKAMDIEDTTSWVCEVLQKYATRWANTPITKRIKVLNESGKLMTPLRVQSALETLSDLSEREALRLLQDLEKRAKNVRNPTGWLVVEVLRRKPPEPKAPAKGKAKGKGKGKPVAPTSATKQPAEVDEDWDWEEEDDQKLETKKEAKPDAKAKPKAKAAAGAKVVAKPDAKALKPTTPPRKRKGIEVEEKKEAKDSGEESWDWEEEDDGPEVPPPKVPRTTAPTSKQAEDEEEDCDDGELACDDGE